jgi:hypothetical protein
MNRGAGHTTALKLEAIAKAIKAQGREVMFVDHYPHTNCAARKHALDIMEKCKLMGLKMMVRSVGQNVYLKTMWFGVPDAHVSERGCKCDHRRA